MHIMELLGKSRVKVEGEKVLDASEPLIEWCPLFDKIRGIKKVTAESAAANMEFRIKNHGMFSARRKLQMGIFVGFGASESMMTGIKTGIIDAAVTVCDGAGSVITANADLVQGMGGYISGLSKDRSHTRGYRGHPGHGWACALAPGRQDRPDRRGGLCSSGRIQEICRHCCRCLVRGKAARAGEDGRSSDNDSGCSSHRPKQR